MDAPVDDSEYGLNGRLMNIGPPGLCAQNRWALLQTEEDEEAVDFPIADASLCNLMASSEVATRTAKKKMPRFIRPKRSPKRSETLETDS